MKAPCLDCPQRAAACHAGCGRYLEYRRNLDEEKERRWKRKTADAELADMSNKRADRIQRHEKRDIRLRHWGR